MPDSKKEFAAENAKAFEARAVALKPHDPERSEAFNMKALAEKAISEGRAERRVADGRKAKLSSPMQK